MTLNVTTWIIIALAVAIPVANLQGRWAASRACDNRHEITQLKETLKTKDAYDKINKQLPYDRDRAERLKWMRQHARP